MPRPPSRVAAPEWGGESLRIIPPTLDRRVIVARPFPPEDLDEDRPEGFAPDDAFSEWIRGTFILGSGPLANEEHAHLMDAHVGVLWTNAVNQSKQRLVLATAEIPQATSGGWRRARHDYQIREWFDRAPDFLLTFYGPECARMDDRAFCALVEHELYHCAQAEGEHGPRFNRETGEPIFAIRGHDVEEFTGVVRRYGATSREIRDLVAAANAAPLLGGAPISHACGTIARAA